MALGRNKVQVTAYMEADLLTRIDECASALGMTRAKMISELLEAAVDQNYNAIHAASKLLKAQSFFKDKINSLSEHLRKVEDHECKA